MNRVLLVSIAVLALLAPSAGATVTPTRDANALAGAIAAPGTPVNAASFVIVPPIGDPNALSDSALGGFPTDGPNYSILSSGDAKQADQPGGSPDNDSDGGAAGPGQSAYDVTTLRIDTTVPQGTNCLALGFRFLSDEGLQASFNDGFIAELDANTWSTNQDNNEISAPDNFAFDQQGRVISVHSEGVAAMSVEEAQGTGYQNATQRLSAAREAAPGPHTLYLSIFDQGDDIVDSAVFVDQVGFLNAAPGECRAGAQTSPPVNQPQPTPQPQQQVLGTVQTGPPPPVQGSSVNVGVVSGKIRYKRRGSKVFEELSGTDQIPVGSTVDANQGRVRLTSAADKKGATKVADFYRGAFVVKQSKGSAVTELKLDGGRFGACPKAGRASASAKKRVRRLFGSGKGAFRTRGRHAAATVRGTNWITEDFCDGTRVKVTSGTVTVRDLVKKKNFRVKKGKSYFARAPR